MKAIITTLVLLALASFATASKQSYYSELRGGALINGAEIHHIDDHFTIMKNDGNWPNLFTNFQVDNKISLGFDRSIKAEYTAAFTTTFDLTIEWEDENFAIQTQTTSLTISLDPLTGGLTKDMDVFRFTGGHNVKVTIDNITGPFADRLILSSEILVERYYAFDQLATPTGLSAVQNADTDNEIEVRWDAMEGAEHYEIEWVFINDYDGMGGFLPQAQLVFDFNRNATAIVVERNRYRITPVFEHGWVLYRVRGVGRHGTSFDYDLEGAWSAIDAGAVDHLSADSKFPTTAHEADGINWSFSSAYTEDNKRFEAVSYMDGLMFNRQNVGKNYTEQKAVVQETYYDHQGRPAVATLPTPVEDNLLGFRESFNRNTNTDPYSRTDFDLDHPTTDCEVEIEGMSDAFGASMYYSPNNTDQEVYQKYIADANDFPFVQTQYMPDNTGRIRRQGAAGDDYQLGSGHETKFLYGTPFQEKVNELFGTNVGWNEKYQRNLVVDANGQKYVSYVDMSGRVIASSLVSSAPTPLDALASNAGSGTQITTDLITDQTNQISSTFGSLTFNKTFTVDEAGIHSFNYGITPDQFEDTCLIGDICFDCVYDLEIILVDIECGDTLIHYVDTIGEFPIDSTCNSVIPYDVPFSTLQASLDESTYSISKTLTINQSALDYYTQVYLDSNTCLLTFDDFYQSVLDSADFSGCNLTPCELSCLTSLGTLEDFVVGGGSAGEYYFQYNQCLESCIEFDPCAGAKAAMLQDLSPGGQYGQYIVSSGVFSSVDPLSVFNTSNSLPSGVDWQTPYFPYQNPDGSASMITNSSGVQVVPTDPSITLTDFILNWQSSWAESLLEGHPEYCYLEFCETNQGSHDYSAYILRTETFDAALDSGYFNPLDMTGLPSGIPSNSSNEDPFFTTLGGVGFDAAMEAKLNNYITFDNTSLSAWELAYFLTYCDDTTDAGIATCLAGLSSWGGDTCAEDLLWANFRDLYLSAKNEFYNEAQIAHALAGSCYNGCFGQTGYSAGSDPNGYNGTDPPCDNPLLWEDVNPRFPDVKFSDYYGLGTSALLTQLQIDVDVQTAAHCQTVCEQQSDDWMQYLVGCGLSTMDSTNIRLELIELCSLGCDVDHPLGSSTLPSPTSTANGNTTFDEVLEFHLGAGYENNLCSAVLIADPPAYTSLDISSDLVTIDTCACDRVLQTYQHFNSGTNIPSGVNSVDELFQLSYGYPLGTLVKPVVCECQAAWEEDYPGQVFDDAVAWGPLATSTLAGSEVEVLKAIACPDCRSCEEINALEVAFDLAYPDADTTPLYTNLFTNYFNDQLGFSLGFDDYQDFLLACDTSTGIVLCNMAEEVAPDTSSCVQEILNQVQTDAEFLFEQYIDSVALAFQQNFIDSCLDTSHTQEFLKLQYNSYEYHTTLYLYDQAGNLARTVPPNGTESTGFNPADVNDDRGNNVPNTPNDTYETDYRYNSFNQVIEQNTPDGGTTEFFYDFAGRLVLSQNAKQAAFTPEPGYSYTLYDDIGRVIEVGELLTASALTEVILKDPTQLQNFIDNSTTRREVTKTFYDLPMDGSIPPKFKNGQQLNLRIRIASVAYYDANFTGSNFLDYDHATHYSYDPHGNVLEVIQDYPRLEDLQQDVKRTEYEFDLISGNVNKVKYQDGDADAFYHEYCYDADNRIERVLTSSDDCVYDQDAHYEYYHHGPLARKECGELQVQACDFTYAINGWLKGMNSNTNRSTNDMGQDGLSGGTYLSTLPDLHKHFAQDELGQTLGYYQGDYTSIGGSTFEAPTNGTVFGSGSDDLFNGNIRHQVLAIGDLEIQGANYQYDQLNRLKASDIYTGLDIVNNSWFPGVQVQDYNTKTTYDANGNILTMKRWGDGAQQIDNFTYNYVLNQAGEVANRLGYVDDPLGTFGSDLGSQNPNNYSYTAIGELEEDKLEGIDNIVWRVDKKIRQLTRTTGSGSSEQIEFEYDAMGNRVLKLVKPTTNGVPDPVDTWTYTYYACDAQGNVMSIYTSKRNQTTTELEEFTQDELNLYGSSRLGQYQNSELIATYNHNTSVQTEFPSDNTVAARLLGLKSYEYTNHLGNVHLVTSDRKFALPSGTGPVSEDFESTVNIDNTAGLDVCLQPVGSVWYVGEISGTTGSQPVVGPSTVLRVENLTGGATSVQWTATTVPGNDYLITYDLVSSNASTALRIFDCSSGAFLATSGGIVGTTNTVSFTAVGTETRFRWAVGSLLPSVSFEIDNITLIEMQACYEAEVLMEVDYYPFGMEQPGRKNVSSTRYRYGFQGQEQDPEFNGEGNSYAYRYRFHDPRVGRFLSIDPLAPSYPQWAPYVFSGNRILDAVELEGLEPVSVEVTVEGAGENGEDLKTTVLRERGTDEHGDPYLLHGKMTIEGHEIDFDEFPKGSEVTMYIDTEGNRTGEVALQGLDVVAKKPLSQADFEGFWGQAHVPTDHEIRMEWYESQPEPRYSWEDCERILCRQKGVDYDAYKAMKGEGLILPGASGSHLDSFIDYSDFIEDYKERPGVYDSFFREYSFTLISNQSLKDKYTSLYSLFKMFTADYPDYREIEVLFYQKNPEYQWMEDE